jgi:ubiquinone/menaquinone biosynthesis C-methylase UbiE
MTLPQRTASYAQVAEHYHAWVKNGHSIHAIVLPLLLDVVGPLEGLHVLDLACGPGIAALELARRGASRVVGVDREVEMLEIARRELEDHPRLRIEYILDDAEHLTHLDDQSFDVAVCNLAITDIFDLPATAHAISRVLRPGGRFGFTIPHPCFQAPGSTWHQDTQGVAALVRGYFREGPWFSDRQISGLYGGCHRKMDTLLNTFTDAGLFHKHSIEPQAYLAEKPGYEEVPVAYIASFIKVGGRS